MPDTYVDAENQVLRSATGVDYAYRTTGASDGTRSWRCSIFAATSTTGIPPGARTADRDAPTSWQTRLAQHDAVCSWGQPNHALLERVCAIDKPVFVANGDSDPMILPHYSYLLTGLIPGARLKIYPDAAHGFLFQHHAEFAADVDAFLTGA